MGPLAQSALVDKNDRPLLAQGFFLSRGHSTFFQWTKNGKSVTSIQPVKEGPDIQSNFFDMRHQSTLMQTFRKCRVTW